MHTFVAATEPSLDGNAPAEAIDSTDLSPTDDALFEAYGQGDMAAFESLYARYRQPLWGFFRRQQDEATASESTQEVWLRVVKQAGRYRAEGRFRSWLFVIAHNVLIDRQRRDGLRLIQSTDEAGTTLEPHDPAPTPAELAETRQLGDRLSALITRLPAVQREALLLREEGGLSLAEIAAVTATSAETAKSRLRYAVRKLREGMRSHV